MGESCNGGRDSLYVNSQSAKGSFVHDLFVYFSEEDPFSVRYYIKWCFYAWGYTNLFERKDEGEGGELSTAYQGNYAVQGECSSIKIYVNRQPNYS